MSMKKRYKTIRCCWNYEGEYLEAGEIVEFDHDFLFEGEPSIAVKDKRGLIFRRTAKCAGFEEIKDEINL